jgi:positive regulator of sigma E activity
MGIQLIVYLVGIIPALVLMVWHFRKLSDVSVMDIVPLLIISLLSWLIVVAVGIPWTMKMLKLDKIVVFKQKK